MMPAMLRQPLSLGRLAALAAGVAAAVTLYCLAYTSLSGRSEPPAEALAWAAVHVLPWLGAFEAAKRARGAGGKVAALLGGLAVSLALGWAGGASEPMLELVRRLPGLALAAALVAGMALVPAEPRRAEAGALPLAPNQIDWVAAAGNYVELHGCGRTILHRATLSAVEAELEAGGFVRIHRSILVRRGRIARVRRKDVLLGDGTSLKLGHRFRARLDA